MGIGELMLLAVGLSMDAFAVAVCKGLSARLLTAKRCLIVGFWFGGFQALMPLLGYLLGATFQSYIAAYDHWIAFGLLALIGLNMIREALSKGGAEDEDACGLSKGGEACDSLSARDMFAMAVATSIDALAVGVTFSFLAVRILPAVMLIGATTFLLTAGGVWIGHRFGARHRAKAEFAGGAALLLLGAKILIEHLF